MSALPLPSPARRSERLPWAALAVVVGAAVGVGAGIDVRVAVALLALPALLMLVVRPEWLPALLAVTVSTEALTVGGVTVSRLAGPFALLVLLLHPTRLRGSFPDRRVLVAVGAYAVWAFASALWSVDVGSVSSGGTAFALSSMALSGIYLAATALLVRTQADAARLAAALAALAVAMGVVAILEYLGGAERSVGTSGDANFFASLQVVAIPVLAMLAGQARRGGLRAACLVGLVIVVGSVLTSLSRGGILALVGVFLLLALQPAQGFFRTRARKAAFVGATILGALALLTVSYNALSTRTSSLFSTGEGGSGRTNLWRAALTGWREHPVRGMGFGAFESRSNDLLRRTPGVDFSAYQLREGGQVVHNAYLESLTEFGVVGLGLFLAVLAATLASLRRAARDAAARGLPFLAALSRALLIALLAFAFTSIFLSTETDRTLWMLMGLALALPRVVRAEASTR